MPEDQLPLSQDQLLHKYPNHHKFQDSLDQHLLFKLNQLLLLDLQLDNHNCSSGSVQSLKQTPAPLPLYKEYLDHKYPKALDQYKHHKELDQYPLLLSVMDYHNNFKVNLDPNFKEDHKGHLKEHLLPLLLDHSNLKQDHHKVLQSDLHHKHSSKDQNNSERPEPHQQDFKEDLLPLQLDFQCSTQHHLEELDFKPCENNETHTLGTLRRLLYSFYYYNYYSMRLWMCINENMLVLLAIILLMLSKKPRNRSLPIPLILLQTCKKCEG